MKKRISSMAIVLVVLTAGSVLAQDLGVKIYPGAKKDEQWTKLQENILKAAGGGTGACYLTKDPVRKVADFYLKEGFKLQMGQVTDDEAMLQKGRNISMTLKNMKPLDNTNNTKICVAKK